MRIQHQKMELFHAFLVVDSRNEHTAGIDTHHGSGRQIRDGDAGLADEFFRFVVFVDPGKDDSVGPGPLGLFGVQFAKLMGCRNIIVVGTPSDKDIRLSVAKKYGATHILINGQDDIPARVREICGPQGLGTVFDFAGPAVITEQAIAMLRRGGEVIRIGIHRRPTETGNYVPLITKAITMRGHMGYDTTSWLQSMRLLEAGMIDVKSEITHELPLEQWREGMELMRTQEAIKVVLHP